MRTCLSLVAAATLALPLSIGCEPRPVVEQPPAAKPTVDVDVNPNGAQPPANEPPATTPTGEKAEVEVEVGSGQGVQVDVDKSAPQQ